MSPRGALLSVAALLTFTACSADEPKTTGRRGIAPPTDLGAVGPAARKADGVAAAEAESTTFADDDWNDWDDSEPTAAPSVARRAPSAEQGPADDVAEPEPPQRDVGRELVELLDLSACLDPAVASRAPGGHFTVHADAYVMYGGRVQSAKVQVPGQPASALDCLAQQLEGNSVPGPVEGAPNRFAGSVQVDYAPAPTSPAP